MESYDEAQFVGRGVATLVVACLPFMLIERILCFVTVPLSIAAGYCYKRTFE